MFIDNLHNLPFPVEQPKYLELFGVPYYLESCIIIVKTLNKTTAHYFLSTKRLSAMRCVTQNILFLLIRGEGVVVDLAVQKLVVGFHTLYIFLHVELRYT